MRKPWKATSSSIKQAEREGKTIPRSLDGGTVISVGLATQLREQAAAEPGATYTLARLSKPALGR